MSAINVTVDNDLADLIPGYLENRRKDIEKINLLIAGGNIEEIKVLAHRMKGSGGGYGFDQITEIGKNMENAAKNSDISLIIEQVKELQNYLDNINVIYSSE
ncbi:MAG: Hpt domain-containing protein [Leptospiraceae bacterium]|nr:Hpt domain-containing protein [Leptospiraceae bacterium]MCB1200456.1 Hpt domain-containing protein [Leptospiraceae bacterium]